MLTIEVADHQTYLKVDRRAIIRAARHALRRQAVADAELSITIADDKRIAELNVRYLGHEGPTDVISFNLSDEDDAALSGEVVVSAERAAAVAARRGADALAELLLYVVHGCLHLSGHDDQSAEDACRMHARENEILTELGYPDVFAGPPLRG